MMKDKRESAKDFLIYIVLLCMTPDSKDFGLTDFV
jgi:hypothetical protein